MPSAYQLRIKNDDKNCRSTSQYAETLRAASHCERVRRRATFRADAGRRSGWTQGDVEGRRRATFRADAGRRQGSTQGDVQDGRRATYRMDAGRRSGWTQGDVQDGRRATSRVDASLHRVDSQFLMLNSDVIIIDKKSSYLYVGNR